VKQDNTGTRIDSRSFQRIGIRVVDFDLTPDGRYLIAVGQPGSSGQSSTSIATLPDEAFDLPLGMYSPHEDLRAKRTQMIIFDLVDSSRRM